MLSQNCLSEKSQLENIRRKVIINNDLPTIIDQRPPKRRREILTRATTSWEADAAAHKGFGVEAAEVGTGCAQRPQSGRNGHAFSKTVQGVNALAPSC